MLNPLRTIIAAFAGTLALLAAEGRPTAQTAGTAALQLEAKIPLGNVSGRIDHMAIDLARQRLFVAELGNNSVGIVDLNSRSVIRTIGGLKEPQVDIAANQIIVGYGGGGLAVIDVASSRKVGDIPLGVHPEGFQLDPGGNQVFVNLPRAKTIAVVDRQSGKQTASWPMGTAGGNFPMALDKEAGHVLTAFRTPPAKLGVFSTKDGALVASPEICGDADDVFVDAKRRRVYVSCGEGFLDVLDSEWSAYRRVARIPTVAGARTSLFVPELDRLLLAVRASSGEPAAIWVFRPIP